MLGFIFQRQFYFYSWCQTMLHIIKTESRILDVTCLLSFEMIQMFFEWRYIYNTLYYVHIYFFLS